MYICNNKEIEVKWAKFKNTFKEGFPRCAWAGNEGQCSVAAFSLCGKGKLKKEVSKVSVYSILSRDEMKICMC